MKIYNTLTKEKENFIPLVENEISMYVCGPTVYSDIHIGNARPVIFFDTIRNYFEFLGYKVNYVSNITDIDDKIINEAKRLKIKEEELTKTYTEAFINASNYLGSNLPNLMPKATNYIDSMLSYIKDLIDRDYAYIRDSGVYFRTNKVREYGKLSGQKIDELEKDVRIFNNNEKEDFKDFTLWKTTTEGLSYNSPWGKGRPGWHTECAVMNNDIFKGTIDIHGGGSDLIFPHHENEIAQTHAHSDRSLANYWMHVARIDFDNKKMSKSLGNTILVKDLIDPIGYRFLILSQHYRMPIGVTEEIIKENNQIYEKIKKTLMRSNLKLGLNYDKDNIIESKLEEFKNYMNDDFNTPNVITLILEIIKDLNKETLVEKNYNTAIKILSVLNLMPKYELTKEIVETYELWNDSRNNKDYEKADIYRKQLTDKGWI